MTSKVCFRCHELLDLEQFYRHPRMADGHLNKCKPCTRMDVALHREVKGDAIRAYDRVRNSLPHRLARRAAYARTEAGKVSKLRSQLKQRATKPERYAAHYAVTNAIRDGRLARLPCLVCGGEAEAHHPDYSRPLDVVWLCRPHHRQAHAVARKGA